MKIVRAAAFTSTAIMLIASTQAQAQSAPQSPTGATAQTEEADQPTEEQEAQSFGDIIVTANRREEREQDVPVSISAFGSQQLEAAGATNIQDIATITPGLTMSNQSAGITPFIRGIGSADNTLGQESAVAVYVDGVYQTSVYASLFSFNNIERVEVLKGPQGTLFGRNATGGLIQVITKDPSFTPTGDFSVSYGSYETIKAQGYVAGGLSDKVALDLAVYKTHQGKGWGRNVTRNSEIGFAGNDTSVRSKLLWEPSADTVVKISGDYSLTDHSDLGATKTFLPGSVSSLDGLGAPGGFYTVRGGAQELLRTEQWGGSIHINHDFGPLSLVNISAFRKSKVVQSFDNDATPLVALDAYIDSQKVRTFTQELQLVSNPGSAVRWIVGAFYLNDKSSFAAPNGLGLFGSAVGTAVLIQNSIDTESIAGYAEVTVPIGDKTEVTGGIRYTHDTRRVYGKTDVLAAPEPGADLVVSIPSTEQSFSEGQPSWRLVLKHEFTPEVMAYASYNRGFKSGNFNAVSAADAPFASEEVDAFEVGFKGDLFDRVLRLNMSAFYYKYSNLQLSVLQGFNLTTINAADSTIQGVDFEGQLAPTSNFRIGFGASILDTKFNDFPNAQCSSRGSDGITSLFSCDVTGNELTRSPKFTANISPNLDIETNGWGTFNLGATYSYNSGFFWEPDNRLKQSAYSLVSGQVSWKDDNSGLGLRVFGKNLFNEEYALWQVAFAFGDEYAPAPPRTYGVELNYSF